jgi:hypothetical protein
MIPNSSRCGITDWQRTVQTPALNMTAENIDHDVQTCNAA